MRCGSSESFGDPFYCYYGDMRKYLSKLPKSTEELLKWYEKFISPLTLLVGFTLDSFALKRVDFFWGNMLLFGYLTIATVSIIVYHLIASGRLKGSFFLWVLPFTTIAIQFGFGGLFSGFVILYSHSAAYATSWIFVVLLAALMIGNERFRKYYTQLAFQVSILFVALLSLLTFFVPVVTGKIGDSMFLISQALALGVVFMLARAFAYFAPEVFNASKWTLRKSIASILLIFNVLYFTNAIPPLPLALKAAQVAHGVQRVGDVYELKVEPKKWYQQYLNYNTTFHKVKGERVYVFTAVFAPTNLGTTIIHNWEHYDEAKKKWVLKSSVAFAINGGRSEGYRGYTFLENALEGRWRVNVQNGGKLLGRVSFKVESVESPVLTSVEEF